MPNTSHLTYQDLENYLKNKYITPSPFFKKVKEHIDSCDKCWKLWNAIRWEKAENKQGFKELKEYLGKEFVSYFDSSWALVEEWNKKDRSSQESMEEFYKSTKNYLYNLVVWNESGDRYTFEKDLELLKKMGVKSIIDFGCGVGNDTLALLKSGFQVIPMELNCPSADFLNWRLKKRGYNTQVTFSENMEKYPDADMFWVLDVLEHVFDPLAVLKKISTKTKVFAHISYFGQLDGGRHPFHSSFSEDILNKYLEKMGFKRKPAEKLLLWVRE